MDFTREPIIETVITPKEGCKIVVRSSKSAGQEEYFVDAVEVVSFGNALFFRSTERPKSFLVPATDYEVLEVREARLVLKNVGLDRAIKIGGGAKAVKEAPQEKVVSSESDETIADEEATAEARAETKVDRKRERRRHQRRRRGGREDGKEEGGQTTATETSNEERPAQVIGDAESPQPPPPRTNSALLPPPSTLISDTIASYKENALFKQAFFTKEDQADKEDVVEEERSTGEGMPEADFVEPQVSLAQPEFGSYEMSEEEEEEIYRKRSKQLAEDEKSGEGTLGEHSNSDKRDEI